MKESSFEHFLEAFRNLQNNNQAFVVATLVHSLGSSPQETGARALISENGLEWGTVGGGKIEVRVIATAQELLRNSFQKNAFHQWNLQKDIGMSCGGVASFFFETFKPENQWKIAIFGAGHVSQELNRLLLNLDCEITCIDPREEWLSKLPRNPRLHPICTSAMADVLPRLQPDTFIVIMTMGHSTDLPILTEALQNYRFPYVGNMGSSIKARVLRSDLRKAGVPSDRIETMFCPIGEPIGTHSPIEISFSIISQLLKVRDSFWSLQEKSNPLHSIAQSSSSCPTIGRVSIRTEQ